MHEGISRFHTARQIKIIECPDEIQGIRPLLWLIELFASDSLFIWWNRSFGMVPEIRVCDRSLDAEGDGTRHRERPLQSRVLQSDARSGLNGGQRHEEVHDDSGLSQRTHSIRPRWASSAFTCVITYFIANLQYLYFKFRAAVESIHSVPFLLFICSCETFVFCYIRSIIPVIQLFLCKPMQFPTNS